MSGFKKKQADDDWICSDIDCKNINYARRTHCYRCKEERKDARKATPWERRKLGTEIGKQVADKSKGLFNAEDWQCSQCANINWSRRQTCNLCNAPKFTENEERTGSGGGYNDRVTVEYKEKVHSDDDEFDEFGRRKKKPERSDESPSANSKDKDNGGGDAGGGVESDEEEEEGDEGDLSKYNLWDSDSNGGEDKEKESSSSSSKRKERPKSKSKSNSSGSRSRSSSSSSRSPARRKRRYSHSSSSSSSSDSSSSSASSYRRRKRRA